ncbi:MAG: 1-deoxy-D-xylulose-5-phosphate synthase [Paramuribaculum sp.]|nr:1-deoxy-D-xylulose-5-phosphate synthase [Paramuribaculum sp.]
MELKDIKSPLDIKGLSVDELEKIAAQMRAAVLFRCSQIGGHVSPNLGSVESIIALHYVFNAPVDKLIFDVSHQAFPHKMLTGRVYGYINPEDFDKVGEYTDPNESPEYDLFYAGHTSPAITLSVGMAKARDLKQDNYNVVSYIGDGALSGGVAFEGLDAGGAMNSNLICIVNDNQMAIAENHGGIYSHLADLRETNGTADTNLFKAFGWDYVYVGEGNDIAKLIETFKSVKDYPRPVVVHINTQKGEGYVPAEKDRESWHFRNPFDISSGQLLKAPHGESYEKVFKQFVNRNAEKYPEFLVITSATPADLGLNAAERAKLGHHYLDVAIAEQTGVSVMAGAARGGAKVVYGVVGTFLQRAYDQLVEDWAMDGSPSLMVVMMTGIRAINDKTHLGFWDIPMITSIPDIVYLAPTTVEEFDAMMQWALDQTQYKVAVRQPVYSLQHSSEPVDTDFSDINKFKVVKKGAGVAVIAAGDFFVKGTEVVDLLKAEGIDATLINPRFISGVDRELIENLKSDHRLIVTLEDGSVEGGFGQRVASVAGPTGMKVLNYGLEKRFEDHYKWEELEESNRLTPAQIVDDISTLMKA